MKPQTSQALMAILLTAASLALLVGAYRTLRGCSGQSAQTQLPGIGIAQANTGDPPAATTPQLPDPNCGYYVGMFVAEHYKDDKQPMYENKINMSLDSIGNGQVTGHSVVAGNLRPFQGSFTAAGPDKFKLVAKEPGDDKYDGEFTATLNASAHTLSGTWVAANKTLPVTQRSYDLTRAAFKYDPKLTVADFDEAEVFDSYRARSGKSEAITADAFKYNASVKQLKPRNVENLYKRDLEVMRNLIYARHGYSFQNRKMRDFFDNYVDWYVPVSVDVTGDLTDIEQKNIALIKRYEQHASSYYDHFGR